MPEVKVGGEHGTEHFLLEDASVLYLAAEVIQDRFPQEDEYVTTVSNLNDLGDVLTRAIGYQPARSTEERE